MRIWWWRSRRWENQQHTQHEHTMYEFDFDYVYLWWWCECPRIQSMVPLRNATRWQRVLSATCFFVVCFQNAAKQWRAWPGTIETEFAQNKGEFDAFLFIFCIMEFCEFFSNDNFVLYLFEVHWRGSHSHVHNIQFHRELHHQQNGMQFHISLRTTTSIDCCFSSDVRE